MYTKEEASAIRHEFWTKLGQYLAPVPGASGAKLNWINYKTGIPKVRFKMDADAKQAIVYISITGTPGVVSLIYNMFESFREALDPGNDWTWEPEHIDEHMKRSARISTVLAPANVFARDKWPEMISFFKSRMMTLDSFWTAHKDYFEMIA
jgi:hypothetical protein